MDLGWVLSLLVFKSVKFHILEFSVKVNCKDVFSVWCFTYPTFPIPLVGEGAGETGMKSILFGEEDFSDLSKSLSLCKYKSFKLHSCTRHYLRIQATTFHGKLLGQVRKRAKTDELRFI